MVSCSFDGAFRIWDAHTAELHCEVRPHDDRNYSPWEFSHVGGYLAFSYHDGSRLLLWRLKQLSD